MRRCQTCEIDLGPDRSRQTSDRWDRKWALWSGRGGTLQKPGAEDGNGEPPDGSSSREGSPSPQLAEELRPFLLGAIPALIPLASMSLFADQAVISAILWQGNVSALFLALVPLLLPMIAGGAVLVLRSWFKGGTVWVFIAFFVTCALLAQVPIAFALFQGSIVLAGAAMRLTRHRIAWIGRSLLAIAGLAAIFSVTFVGLVRSEDKGLWSGLARTVAGRAISGIPVEVITYREGSRIEENRVSVVNVDEEYITALDLNPPTVITISNDSVVSRVPCQPREEGWQRSPIEIGFHSETTGTKICKI
jgi:hypothetical protein